MSDTTFETATADTFANSMVDVLNHGVPGIVKTQDGRKLRRYKRRWKIERLFAHLGNFRRLVVRYERYPQNFLAFLQLGCIKLLLRRF